MKISLITVCYQAADTILDTIASVKAQKDCVLEYIVIDGGSKDNTLNLLQPHRDVIDVLISAPDQGIYDAMNKGIRLATGDVIGFLNADDQFTHERVLHNITQAFLSQPCDVVYADLIYCKKVHAHEKIVRYFKSRSFQPGLFAKGWCPPHPTFYAKRSAYERCGLFDLSLTMGNDVELMMRFLEKYKLPSLYIPEIWVKMAVGGVSNQSFKNIWRQNWAVLSAAKRLNIRMPVIPFAFHKFVDRLGQFLMRPSRES